MSGGRTLGFQFHLLDSDEYRREGGEPVAEVLSIPFIGFRKYMEISAVIYVEDVSLSIPFIGFLLFSSSSVPGEARYSLSIPFIGFIAREQLEEAIIKAGSCLSIPFIGFTHIYP